MSEIFDYLDDQLDLHTEFDTPTDRYGAFMRVFSTDEGKRVLREIMIMGRLNRSTAARGDPYETYLREGERNLAIKIFNCAHIEPRAVPERQQTKDTGDG